MLRIRIEHDPDALMPFTYGDWRLTLFPAEAVHLSIRHVEGGKIIWANTTLGIKFRAGTLSLLVRDGPALAVYGSGTQVPATLEEIAGLIAWYGSPNALGANLATRKTMTHEVIGLYNAWKRGENYRYKIEIVRGAEAPEHVHGDEGITGQEYLVSNLISNVLQSRYPGEAFEVEGDAAWIVEHYPIRSSETPS